MNLANWGRQGDLTSAHSDKQKEPTLAQVSSSSTIPPKMVTNSYAEVKKDLQKEKDQELVKPTQLSQNAKDPEPANVQLGGDIKK
jgi:hypothetical protein